MAESAVRVSKAFDDSKTRARSYEKSKLAFRTIGEAAVELDVAPHVLRFWEGKFSKLRPPKRGGGRRYYRPEDMDQLRRIRALLYDEGYTIKGVQRLLKEGRGRAAVPDVDDRQPTLDLGVTRPTVKLSAGQRKEMENVFADLQNALNQLRHILYARARAEGETKSVSATRVVDPSGHGLSVP